MARRSTQAEKQQKRDAASARAWEHFRAKLAAVANIIDAEQLVLAAPPPGTPGREYFSNLGTFLQFFVVPDGSTAEERRLYMSLIERLDGTGVLKPGVRKQVVEAIRSSFGE